MLRQHKGSFSTSLILGLIPWSTVLFDQLVKKFSLPPHFNIVLTHTILLAKESVIFFNQKPDGISTCYMQFYLTPPNLMPEQYFVSGTDHAVTNYAVLKSGLNELN
jgi:hypothetical protein